MTVSIRTPNRRIKSTSDIRSWKGRHKKVHFKITAEFITRHAQELWNEGEGREAMGFLASSIGMCPTEAVRLCKGDAILFDLVDGSIGYKFNFRIRESKMDINDIVNDRLSKGKTIPIGMKIKTHDRIIEWDGKQWAVWFEPDGR